LGSVGHFATAIFAGIVDLLSSCQFYGKYASSSSVFINTDSFDIFFIISCKYLKGIKPFAYRPKENFLESSLN
jgi:hypothetical protein